VTAELLSQRLEAAAAHMGPGQEKGEPTRGPHLVHPGKATGPEAAPKAPGASHRIQTGEGGLGVCDVPQLIPPHTPPYQLCLVLGDPAGGALATTHAPAPAPRQPGLGGPHTYAQLPLGSVPAPAFSALQGAEALEALIGEGRPQQGEGGAHGQREGGEGVRGAGRETGGKKMGGHPLWAAELSAPGPTWGSILGSARLPGPQRRACAQTGGGL